MMRKANIQLSGNCCWLAKAFMLCRTTQEYVTTLCIHADDTPHAQLKVTTAKGPGAPVTGCRAQHVGHFHYTDHQEQAAVTRQTIMTMC